MVDADCDSNRGMFSGSAQRIDGAEDFGIADIILTGDLDGQFGDDIVVNTEFFPGEVRVYTPDVNGNLTLSQVLVTTTQSNYILADVNGDGNLDLLIASLVVAEVMFHAGAGDGTFSQTAQVAFSSSVADLQFADLIGNSVSDLVVASNNGLFILEGNVNDGYVASEVLSSEFFPMIEVGDFDGDGNLDVAGANSDGVTVFLQDAGVDTFREVALAQTIRIQTLSTIKVSQTKDELVSTSPEAGVLVYKVDLGDIEFEAIPAASGSSGASAFTFTDIDGDGNNEFIFASVDTISTPSQTSLAVSSGNNIVDVVAVDVNGDGAPDLVATTNTGIFVLIGGDDTAECNSMTMTCTQ